jgi:hypothetical protein
VIGHIGKPLAARGWLCAEVVNWGGKPRRFVHQSTRENERDRFDTVILDPLLFVRAFHLFSAEMWQKFPVHSIVHFQPSSIANRTLRAMLAIRLYHQCSTFGVNAHISGHLPQGYATFTISFHP